MMSATVLTTGLTTGPFTVAARGARWCRAASRARRSATPTVRIPLPMATTLLNRPAGYRRTMITFRHPGTVLTDRFFAVPLDHQRPDGEQIEAFAREVVAADKADADLPWLLFLQGGPGSARSGPRAGTPG